MILGLVQLYSLTGLDSDFGAVVVNGFELQVRCASKTTRGAEKHVGHCWL